MRFHIKAGSASIQLNKDALYYVGKFISEGKLTFKGVELADFLAQGFGWFRVISEKMNSAVLLLQACIKKYRQERDAECRALLAIAAGAKVIAVSASDAPFLKYTLEPQVVSRPKVVETPLKVLERTLRETIVGMRATREQLAALTGKFKVKTPRIA